MDDGGGVVGGTVVDYEDIGVPGASCNAAENAGEGGFDARALIVGRDDDAETRRSHRVEWPISGGEVHSKSSAGGWHMASQPDHPATGSGRLGCSGTLSPGRLPSYDIC